MSKKQTFIKKRKLAIVLTAALLVILAVAMVFILDYVNATSVEDPADGTVYFIRQKKQVYALYDTDKKTVMPTDAEYGYYVTRAGSLIKVDAQTGEYEVFAVVDTEGNEQTEANRRLLMFQHLEGEDIKQIDVYNSQGSFTFARLNPETGRLDPSADFAIKGSVATRYDQEKFIELHVRAGYTVTTQKLSSPIKDADGLFTEYGLAPQRRVREVIDENGAFVRGEDGSYVYEEYDYVPSYYVITAMDGQKYKVIIGDRLVSGNGYYAQYVAFDGERELPRDAVYVLGADIENTLLARVEDFVTPAISYPMTDTTYTDVQEFFIVSKDPGKDDHSYLDPVVGFSYIDLSERENTVNGNVPYVFLEDFKLDGYQASSENIGTCLAYIHSPEFVTVKKLAPSMEDLVKYGIVFSRGTDDKGEPKYEFLPEHLISFNYDATDENGNFVQTVNNSIYVSKKNENGNYYVYTDVYKVDKNGDADELLYTLNMVVEVKGHVFEFLNWDRYAWISSSYMSTDIAFCDKITMTDHKANWSATFELDNSETASVSDDPTSTELLKIIASVNGESVLTTFSTQTFTDEHGLIWTVTSSDIVCHSPLGEKLTLPNAYYADNAIGRQVRSYRETIVCADGRLVTVTPDTVEVRGAQNVTYVRYDIHNFRQLYRTLLYSSITDSYELSDSAEQELINNPDNLLYTITLTEKGGKTYTYRFYYLSSRKSYISINGNGGFYVLSTRTEKIFSDAHKFFDHIRIYDTAKN